MAKVIYTAGHAVKVERKRNPTPKADWGVLFELEKIKEQERRDRAERARARIYKERRGYNEC
jgi:hypothetical protein